MCTVLWIISRDSSTFLVAPLAMFWRWELSWSYWLPVLWAIVLVLVQLIIIISWLWTMINIMIVVVHKLIVYLIITNLLLELITSILIYLIHFLLRKLAMALKHLRIWLRLFESILRCNHWFLDILIYRGHLCLRFLVFDNKVLRIQIIFALPIVWRRHAHTLVRGLNSF